MKKEREDEEVESRRFEKKGEDEEEKVQVLIFTHSA